MGFDLTKKTQILSEKDRKILEEICKKNNISLELVENLLRIEKEYQLKERRIGVFDKLKEIIENCKI